MSLILNNLSDYNFEKKVVFEFKQQVLKAERIIILPHSSADGDALGAAFGLKHFLMSLNKEVVVVCPDEPSVKYFSDYLIKTVPFQPDLVISVDTATLDRCFYPDEFRSAYFINIDHHVSNSMYANLNIVVGTAPSACEVVTVLLQTAFGDNIFSTIVAESLLFGLLSDTMLFRTAGSSNDTLLIANFLTQSGANFAHVRDAVCSRISFENLKVWSAAILEGVLLRDNCLLIAIPYQKLVQNNLNKDSFGGFVSFVSKLVDVDVVMFLLEVEPGVVKGSLRSTGYDVNSFCKKFGGGGHVRASGFRVSEVNLSEFVETIKNHYLGT